MAENNTSAAVQGNVMLYNNPVPLAKDQHSKMGVSQIDKPFAFMATAHFLPLTAPEFGAASSCYPIIFAGDERNPLAVLGIRQNENLMIDREGNFNTDFYMPAFARRYPFVLAGDEANDRFVVCIDQEAECVAKKNPDRPFFDGDNLSGFTNEAFEFLKAFETDRRATQTMINRFKELDLFEQKDMHFQGNNADGTPGERQKIADYFAISEDRLRALGDAQLRELNDKGYIGVAYAHILSLNNWQRLVNMTMRRAAEEAANA